MTTDADSRALGAVLLAAGVAKDNHAAVLAGDPGCLPRLTRERALALVMVDPVAIQEMVTGCRRLKSMSGASKALAEWDAGLRTRIPKDWAVLFGGAGQAVLLGPADTGEAVARELAGTFEGLLHGTLGWASLPVSPWELVNGPPPSTCELSAEAAEWVGIERKGGGGFGVLLGRLAARLRDHKDGGGSSAEVVTGERCKDCGVRARVGKERCKRCEGFHAQGEQGMERWEDSRLAYLSMDGTDISTKLRTCQSISDYMRVSAGLHAAFGRTAIEDHLDRLGIPEDRRLVLVAGGDDVRLVLPAGTRGRSFEVALDLADGIRERYRAQVDDNLEVGVGLVVTRHLDARDALALAWALVRNAKDHSPGSQSAIDFEIVTGGTSASTGVDALRTGRLKSVAGTRNARFQLQLRPYPLAEARELLEVARHLAGAPDIGRSALYNLRRAFEDDPILGLVTTQYLLSKSKASAAWRGRLGLAPTDVGRALDDEGWGDGWLYRRLDPERALPGDANERTWGTGVPDLVDLTGLVMDQEA